LIDLSVKRVRTKFLALAGVTPVLQPEHQAEALLSHDRDEEISFAKIKPFDLQNRRCDYSLNASDL
jgi:hypothetical protein